MARAKAREVWMGPRQGKFGDLVGGETSVRAELAGAKANLGEDHAARLPQALAARTTGK